MGETGRQIVFAVATAAVATVVLVPTFIILKILLDAGLVIILVSVVTFGLTLGYLLHRETSR
jgi:hypothetical protein